MEYVTYPHDVKKIKIIINRFLSNYVHRVVSVKCEKTKPFLTIWQLLAPLIAESVPYDFFESDVAKISNCVSKQGKKSNKTKIYILRWPLQFTKGTPPLVFRGVKRPKFCLLRKSLRKSFAWKYPPFFFFAKNRRRGDLQWIGVMSNKISQFEGFFHFFVVNAKRFLG